MHIVHTIMARIAKLRVHIAPVGYEIDRIVLSARQEKADRVWLLLHENKSDDKAGPFITEITSQLEKQKIEVREEYHDRRDLFKIIRAVRNIIGQEKGNEIYVNLASGSKIQAIGTMMACMMFNDDDESIHPFYVEAEHYPGFEGGEPISTGIKEIQDVPPYSIKIPEQKLISALEIILEKNGRLTKKEMAQLAEERKLITINAIEKNHSMARFASLDKNIIQPLEEWGLVETEKIGRNRWIKITREGENASKFLI